MMPERKLELAIETLRQSVWCRFGDEADTSAGAATLYISRDRVELTDAECEVIADKTAKVAKALA